MIRDDSLLRCGFEGDREGDEIPAMKKKEAMK